MTETPAPADPERALALAYAPRAVRPALSLLWRLDERLGAIVAATDNPALGQIRLAWWRDALASLRDVRPVDPLLIELRESGIDATTLLPLIDGWEALLEPVPLPEDAIRTFADQRGAGLFEVAAGLLGGDPVKAGAMGRLWALADLAFRISDRMTAMRTIELARDGLGSIHPVIASAVKQSSAMMGTAGLLRRFAPRNDDSIGFRRGLERRLRPLSILAALAAADVKRGIDTPRRQGSPRRVARALIHFLTGL